MVSQVNINQYPLKIRPLSKKEGGGYLVEFPDLPGCMSDGETIEDAIKNGYDAVKCWILDAKESGREIPKPYVSEDQNYLPKVPKSLKVKLISEAKHEGVSYNTLVVSIISERIGKLKSHSIKKKVSRVRDTIEKGFVATRQSRKKTNLKAGKGKRPSRRSHSRHAS